MNRNPGRERPLPVAERKTPAWTVEELPAQDPANEAGGACEESMIEELDDNDVLEIDELSARRSDDAGAIPCAEPGEIIPEPPSEPEKAPPPSAEPPAPKQVFEDFTLEAERSTPQILEQPFAKNESEPMRSIDNADTSERISATGAEALGEVLTSPKIVFDQRKHNRVQVHVAITLQSESNFWTGVTMDMSTGGLFVATYNILPIGTKLDVNIDLAGKSDAIQSRAEVRWIREYRDDNEMTPGMGIQFLDMSKDDTDRVNAFINNRDTLLYEH